MDDIPFDIHTSISTIQAYAINFSAPRRDKSRFNLFLSIYEGIDNWSRTFWRHIDPDLRSQVVKVIDYFPHLSHTRSTSTNPHSVNNHEVSVDELTNLIEALQWHMPQNSPEQPSSSIGVIFDTAFLESLPLDTNTTIPIDASRQSRQPQTPNRLSSISLAEICRIMFATLSTQYIGCHVCTLYNVNTSNAMSA